MIKFGPRIDTWQVLDRWANTLRPRQNGRQFPDDNFKCIFLNKNIWISIKISLKFVPKGPINNIPALVQIMVWFRSGDKPLSELMVVSVLMQIRVSRSQWAKINYNTNLTIIPWKQTVRVLLTYNRVCRPAAITEPNILVPCHVIKSV